MPPDWPYEGSLVQKAAMRIKSILRSHKQKGWSAPSPHLPRSTVSAACLETHKEQAEKLRGHCPQGEESTGNCIKLHGVRKQEPRVTELLPAAGATLDRRPGSALALLRSRC